MTPANELKRSLELWGREKGESLLGDALRAALARIISLEKALARARRRG